MKPQFKPWPLQITLGLMLSTLSSIKLSYLIGSRCAFFATTSFLAPLGAFLGGLPGLAGVILGKQLLIAGTLIGRLYAPSAYHIPTVCASLYATAIWAQGRKAHPLMRCAFALIPLSSMLLFLSDEQGAAAAPYTLFWLIPMISALVPHANGWLHALATTFTAHAVGSVLWMYTHTMTTELWLGLIPIVCYERLLLGTTLWLTVHAAQVIAAYTQARFRKNAHCTTPLHQESI
jgi:hypothetical protein